MIDIGLAIGIGAGVLSIGFAIAWVIGARTREGLIEMRARLPGTEQQLSDSNRELDAARADVVTATVALRSESTLRATAEASSARVPELERALEDQRRIAAERQAEIGKLQIRAAEQQKATDEKLKLLSEAESSLSNAFKALSAEALKHNNQSFIQLATASLEKFQQVAKSRSAAQGSRCTRAADS